MAEQLFEQTWPVQGATAGVGIVHGLAEHSGRYAHVAAALNAAGYSVHAIDLPGHGHSPGFPGEMGGSVDTVIRAVVAWVNRVTEPYEDFFLLAHSMGTLMAMPAVTELPSGTLDGLILSGVAVLPGPAIMESLASGEGVPPDQVSRDPGVVQAYKEDELVFYDRVPNELMGMAAEATQKAVEAIPMIRIPVLLLHGTDDTICALEGAQHVHVQLVGTDKTLRVYRGLYHEVLNEPEKDEVLRDVVAWLDERRS